MPLLTDYIHPKKLIFRGKVYTSEWFARQIDQFAFYLDENIRSNSPFVYLFAPNHIKMAVAFFGIIKSGRICVLVDPVIGKLELEEMRQDTIPSAEINIDVVTDEFDYPKEILITDKRIDEELLRDLDDVCTIVYTAADDGYAKGAMLTNKSFVADACSMIECNNINESSAVCALIAFHHLFACQTGLITPCVAGATLLIEHMELRKIRSMTDEMFNYRMTHFYSVPMVFAILKKVPDLKNRMSSVTYFATGGCKLSETISVAYLTDYGFEIHKGYGLTEASPVCSLERPGDTIRMDSVGRALTCCEITVHDQDDKPLPVGQIGEVHVKGGHVMKGYFRNRMVTEQVLRNGILRTGDLGKLDKDGYLYLTGLKKNMVNADGNKIYPLEVLRLLRKNPCTISVKNVALDVANKKNMKVEIELRTKGIESESEFIRWCKQAINSYKIPEVLFK